jgi:HAD superfamily hydrolase (TIGR01509 family)
MPAIEYVFLDDGGVMNDNERRAPEWRRLIGEFFPPRLGGTAEDWSAANLAIMPELETVWTSLHAGEGAAGWSYAPVWRAYEIKWLRLMAAAAGKKAPLDDDECHALAHEAAMFITRGVRASFPEVIGTLQGLAASHVLATASNEHSQELRGYLEGMGVPHLFRHFYGPDLIDATKQGPTYYRRMFDHAGIDPARSVVVDDSPAMMAKIVAAGARAVLVARQGPRPQVEGVAVVRDLSELQSLLAAWQ